MELSNKWDCRFIDLADYVAQWSRDPSTQVGAVIVRNDKTVASLGFNGFPRGVIDSTERYNDRPTKYKFICHAESNAILTAQESLHSCTIYTSPLYPCNECAKMIIQSGITRVVTRKPENERWNDSNSIAAIMFEEAGISVDYIDTST